MKAQIKNEDVRYLITMMEDLFSVRRAKQINLTEGDFHTTVEYSGNKHFEMVLETECVLLNKKDQPAYKTRGEEMLAELTEINKDLEAKTLKLKIDFEVKKALREVLALTYDFGATLEKTRQELTKRICKS